MFWCMPTIPTLGKLKHQRAAVPEQPELLSGLQDMLDYTVSFRLAQCLERKEAFKAALNKPLYISRSKNMQTGTEVVK